MLILVIRCAFAVCCAACWYAGTSSSASRR
jgi:hypothetical protein